MSDEKSYKSTFFVVPSRILNLPGLTLAFLKVYETVFQFWNHGQACWLGNDAIKERTGIESDSTIREAFIFFEKNKEMKRKTIGKKRYLEQPKMALQVENVPVDKPKKRSKKIVHPVDLATSTRRFSDGLPVDLATHNNKKINNKNRERKKRAPLSENFIPNEKMIFLLEEISIKNNISSDKLLIKFKNVQKSKDKLSADWNAELENFLINEKPNLIIPVKRLEPIHSEMKSTVKWFNDNH